MILTCPSCGTQYAVKDGAIPPGGRKVRCATCGHSWHQDPESQGKPEERVEGETAAPDIAEPSERAPDAQRDVGPGDSPQAYETIEPDPPGAPLVEPPGAIPVPPPETPAPAFAPRREDDQWDLSKEIPDAEEIEAAESETRSDRKRNWLMAILLAMVVVAAVFLAFWFLAPESLRQQVGFEAAARSPLQIAPGTPERQRLASGNELVVVSGRVINPSSREQPVPPIEAQLRDSAGRLVYSWEIPPPARTLPPGGSASFNSAEMGVPSSGVDSTVTLTLKG